jgi:hypothetical protein
MSVPIQVQLFDAFLGAQEGIHSVILPDILSSGGSKNLWIDKYGRAKKILGYSKQNSGAAVLTNGGTSAVLGRGLFGYKKQAGGSTSRVLLGVWDDGTDEWEIWRSGDSGLTWTFLYDAGAGSVGMTPDFAQFGDNLFITNGKMAPRVTADGITVTAAGSTPSPTPTVAAGAAGALSGVFGYKLVSLQTGGVRKYGSATSTVVNLASKQGAVSWTADPDGTVIGYELYRTTGSGEVFYYVDYIDGRTTAAYTDNVTDLTILSNRVLEEHGDAPPTSYFAEPHKQRMWWLRTDAVPTRGYFSDPARPDSCLLAANYIDFSDSETVGDFITGAIGNYEGQLIVFTEKAVWAVSGTGQVIGNIVDWTKIRTNAQIGGVSHRAAVRVPAGSKYLDQKGREQTTNVVTIAYLTPYGDIRLFDGDNDTIISLPVKNDLTAVFNYANRHKSFAVHDTTRSEVTWVFPVSTGGSEPSAAVTWNYRWGVWYAREWGFGHAIEADDATTAQVMLAQSNSTATGGYCYKLWSGTSFDGTAIAARWMTKTLYGVNDQGQPAISNTKRFRWADFLFETEQTVTLTVEWLAGNSPDNGAAFGTTLIAPAAFGLLTAGGDRIMSATLDHLVVALASSEVRAILVNSTGDFLHHEGIRMRIGDNASLGSWSLEAFNLAYQILPGLQRRMQGAV